ncbi:hypothetical protein CJ030_MR2G002977 [Morella rubra]|uniref:Uncharacterized protein n=1 Tax=Morella rubra TaxID=262757 RepID=A0A6A1WEE4_9ROSI|nr:hypothetical protein CJ030_MR2G003167 [Morella rubra]KAB1223223.1 hypothetical protein CJ030_MR2G002977 [Morella rubra]
MSRGRSIGSNRPTIIISCAQEVVHSHRQRLLWHWCLYQIVILSRYQSKDLIVWQKNCGLDSRISPKSPLNSNEIGQNIIENLDTNSLDDDLPLVSVGVNLCQCSVKLMDQEYIWQTGPREHALPTLVDEDLVDSAALKIEVRSVNGPLDHNLALKHTHPSLLHTRSFIYRSLRRSRSS